MENQKGNEKAIAEEKVLKPLDQCEIGEPQPPLEPKEVEVIGLEFPKEGENKPMKVVTKHPDKEESLDLTSVKYEKDSKIMTTGLWVERDKKDKDKIKYNNAVVALLKYYKAKTPGDLIGQKLQTTTKDNNFLTIKAY